jgi:pimeloyl-ACP methyl ester carboxylesterase
MRFRGEIPLKAAHLSIVSRVALAGLAVQACFICGAQQERNRFVDLGGYRLNVSEAGSGGPTVVFEAGLGEDLTTWNDVRPQVSQFTRTVTYDRAGLGRSDPSPNPRTVEELTVELHEMLHKGGIAAPYVLVGHSLGGAIIQLFSHDYPDEVAGLVLVDPEDGRILQRLQAALSAKEWASRKEQLDAMMAHATPTQRAELNSVTTSGDALAGAFPLPKVPMVLLTGTLKDPSFPGNPTEQDIKLQLHKEFLAKVPQAKHVLVPNSRHYIQNDAPQLVIEAVRTVVEQARKAGTHESER